MPTKVSVTAGVFVLTLLSLVGLFALQFVQHNVPAVFVAITFTLVGASAGITVPTVTAPTKDVTP